MKAFEYQQLLLVIFLQAQNCISLPDYHVRDSKLILDDKQQIYLEVKKQNIEKLYNTTFSGATNLEILDLKSNSIQEIESGAFKDLKKLKFLYLNDNKIKKLPKGIFDSLENIEEIWLSENRIKKIDKELFAKNLKLRSIYFYDNKIVSIDESSFAGLKNLKTLDLRENVCVDKNFENFKSESAGLDDCYNHCESADGANVSPAAIFFISVVILLIIVAMVILVGKIVKQRRARPENGVREQEIQLNSPQNAENV